jgi:hypothetical protein
MGRGGGKGHSVWGGVIKWSSVGAGAVGRKEAEKQPRGEVALYHNKEASNVT